MLTLSFRTAKIPMIVTNHTYDVIGSYVPTKEMGGGFWSQVCSKYNHLSLKEKEKDGTEIVGNIIKAKTAKSRLSKENKEVEIRLFYDERGLDKYYGLLELGEKYGFIERVGNRYRFGGATYYPKTILADPEAYFDDDLLQKIDEAAKQEFSYGVEKQ